MKEDQNQAETLQVILPEGKTLTVPVGTTIDNIAKKFSKDLAKTCVAGYIDDQLVDASEPVIRPSTIRFVMADESEGLEIVRHSCAHLFAHAVSQLYPDAKFAIGPTIEDGFYYDIDMEAKLQPADLVRIENKMRKLASRNYPVVREVVAKTVAFNTFADLQQNYKQHIVERIPAGETIALYRHQEYTDMCRGPHVTSTKHLKHFKLTSIAGAYWLGDSNQQMLQRVYGTAWSSAEALNEYITLQEESKKRDHRVLGKAMEMFHLQPEGPGMIFWHHKGTQVYNILEQYIRDLHNQYGYIEVRTPQLLDSSLWEQSGHKEKFGDNMFLTGSEDREFAIKPMNCPGHVQIYKSHLHSYRDLPLRMAEFGVVHRNEASGTLHGLMRVRCFTQDDAHIFCTPEQIQSEISSMIDFIYEVYGTFGFNDIAVKLSTKPEKRVGSDEIWDLAEKSLAEALSAKGIDFTLNEGEGAFYGPKIEFVLRDALKRHWQCGTIQLDFSIPQLLDANYIDSFDTKQRPVMIHRAILGSLERFIGILIEHYAGWLPLWLAPVQVEVLPISEKQNDYAASIISTLKKNNIRCELDARNEKIGYKIRTSIGRKSTYLLIVGEQEQLQGTVTLRHKNDDLGAMTLDNVLALLKSQIDSKGNTISLSA